MKSSDPSALLSLKELPPLVLITGGSSYDREVLLGRLGVKRGFASEELSAKRLSEELTSGSLFSSKRTLILRHLSKLGEEAVGILAAYSERPDPFLTVIGEGESCPEALVRAASFHLDFGRLPPWEEERALVNWLQQKSGGGLAPGLAQLMVERVGLDKRRLAGELEKLLLHSPKITRADIEALVVSTPQGSVWELGRAILSQDPKQALSLLRGMGEGIGLFGTLAALRSQIETHLICASAASQDEIAKALPKLKGRQLERTVELARRYGERRCRTALIAIGKLEGEAKSRTLSEEIALEWLTASLAT